MIEGALQEILTELGIEILNRNGSGWFVCRCPFAPLGLHSKSVDHDPSFFVKPNATGFSGFNCFTCKQHGTISALVTKLEYYSGESYGNLSTRANLKELQVDFGKYGEWSDDEAPPDVIPESLYSGVFSLAWESDRAVDYLADRGVDRMAAMDMGLLYDDDGYRILFPVRNYSGGLFGFSGRSVIPDNQRRNAKVKDYAGLKKMWVILGEDLVRKSDEERDSLGKPRRPVLVVEGLFAYAHLIAIGAREWVNPVASLGSKFYVQQRDRLSALDRPVYFLYDDDLAGDIGLYGDQDPKTGEHKGGGALDIMKDHAPTFLCYYPERFAEGEGDPDALTMDDLFWILSEGNELYSVIKG